MSRLFYLLLTAHFLGDFVFQSNGIASRKKLAFPERVRPTLEHCCQLLIITLLLYLFDSYFLLGNFSFSAVFLIVLVCAIHGGIDLLKPWIRGKLPGKMKDVATFLLDQLLHLISIFLVLLTFFHKDSYVWLSILGVKGAEVFYAGLACLMFSTMFGAYFIRIFLRAIDVKAVKKAEDQQDPLEQMKGQESFGLMIGIIERTLIFLFVVSNAYAGVATVVAVKSLARFKEIENNRDFAEYYLIGNLLSLSFGLIGGLLFLFLR